MTTKVQNVEIDPDPFTIAAAWIAGGSFLLQFIQVAQGFRGNPPRTSPGDRGQRENRLTHLRDELRSLVDYLDRVDRRISRGSSDADRQFFEAPLRIGATSMLLTSEAIQAIRLDLNTVFTKIGAVSIWASHVIADDPEACAQLANRMQEVADVPDRLNEALASGAPIRDVIFEVRRVFVSTERAISDLLNYN